MLRPLLRSLASTRRAARAAVVAMAVAGAASPALAATVTGRDAALVVDAATGRTLYARNADELRYPASLTKMMTLYVLFEEMERGRINNDTRLTVSAHAAAQAPSKLGLKPGQTITALDAIRALVTKSANDAAVVIAENVAGSEPAFARRMTDTARRIGMRSTVFRNANGLPNPGQYTTARDLATLGLALQRRFPTLYKHFSTRQFVFRGATHRNHNKLLGRVEGVDGIKTGFIRASGFNLVTSAKRNGRQIVAVVLGGATGRSRDNEMAGLVERYLPQATRTSGALVASAAPAVDAPAPVEVAEAAPPLPASAPRAEVAETAPAAADAAPMVLAYADPNADASAPAAEAPAAAASSEEAEGDTETGDADEPREIAAVIPSAAREGWKIQIGAMPDRDAAVAYLTEAQGRFGGLLGKREPYTEAVSKGSTTLYRARFAGFDTQAAARAACAQLAKRDYACLAIRQ